MYRGRKLCNTGTIKYSWCVYMCWTCLCVFRLSGQVADDPVTDVSEISWLESTHPRMPFACRFRRALLTVMSKVVIVAVGGWSKTCHYRHALWLISDPLHVVCFLWRIIRYGNLDRYGIFITSTVQLLLPIILFRIWALCIFERSYVFT